MSVNEGFTSAVEFLKDVVIREPAAQAVVDVTES